MNALHIDYLELAVKPRKIPAGSYVVPLDQPEKRMIQAILEPRTEHFLSGTRICGGFEHDELPRSQYPSDLLGGPLDERDVGLSRLSQWSRHTDNDRVGILQ